MSFEWDPSEAKEKNPETATTESTDTTTESLAVTARGDRTVSTLGPKPPPIWQDDRDGEEEGGGRGDGKGGGGKGGTTRGGPYEDGRLGEALGKLLTWIVENIPNWFPVFDKAGRSNFTQTTVKYMFDHNTDDSVAAFLVCYVDHYALRAVWSSYINFGNLTYAIYAFPRGQAAQFKLNGDGGYINWAVYGYFERDGNLINFL